MRPGPRRGNFRPCWQSVKQMAEKSINIMRPDGLGLFALRWDAQGAQERHRVFLGHSHVVHAGMMRPLARGFVRAGCGVLAGDIRGHGRSVNRANPIAHLAGRDGWRAAVDDLLALLDHCFDGVPFERRMIVVPNILALMTLDALRSRPDLAGRIVLIAPPPNQPLIARLGTAFALARARFRDADTSDEQFLHHIYTFLGSQLPERHHLLDVVTPDRAMLQRILDDPLSWNVPTTAYWQAVFHGMTSAWDWPRAFRLHPETRFLILYGEADPMTRDGAFCHAMVAHLKRHGAREAASRGIAGARTGLFLEEERLGIARRIMDWAEQSPLTMPRPDLPRARTAIDFAREHVTRIEDAATPEPEVLSPTQFVSLCYAGIQDETRWVELLMRMSLLLSEQSSDRLESFMVDMMPHWDQAFRLQQMQLTHAALGNVWSDVLDRLGMACALVDARGRVLHENRRYRAALAACMKGEASGLSCAPDTSTGAMTQALLAASTPHDGVLAPSGTVLQWEGEPVGLFFRPPALDRHARQLGHPIGLLLLREREEACNRTALLECAYGLTPQEAQVALSVMRGEAPAAIARRMALSIHTIRTHLAQAYAKTGSAGKAEMTAQLLQSPLGWFAQPEPATDRAGNTKTSPLIHMNEKRMAHSA